MRHITTTSTDQSKSRKLTDRDIFRSGTVPTPLAVGLGEACRLAKAEMEYDHAYVSRLSNKLRDMISAELESVVFNGDPDHTYPGMQHIYCRLIVFQINLIAVLKDFPRGNSPKAKRLMYSVHS